MHPAAAISSQVADPIALWESPAAELLLIKEVYLHYLWRTRQIPSRSTITDGREINISSWGQANDHDGPDFLHGQLSVEGVDWSGHIEMHVRSSDWYRHQHHMDAAYDQVILHVVWVDDRPVMDKSGSPIPTLVLSEIVEGADIERVQRFISTDQMLPCQAGLGTIPSLYQADWLSGLVHDRLRSRTTQLLDRLHELRGDWAQLCYEMLARALGSGTNADTMQYLATRCPWALLRKVRQDVKGTESMLLGMAGWLPEESHQPYIAGSVRQFSHFMRKYGCKPIPDLSWRTRGVRPYNQPVMRIIQLAAILGARPTLFDTWLEASSMDDLMAAMNVEVALFWRHHRLDGEAAKRDYASIRASMVHRILINAVIPICYAHGIYTNSPQHCDRALRLLQALPPERHSITRRFTSEGWQLTSAADSQALLHAYRHLCRPKKCLSCRIGCRVLNQGLQ